MQTALFATQLLVTALPFLFLFASLFYLKRSIFQAAIIACSTTLLLTTFYWGVGHKTVLAAAVKSLLITTEIGLILIGALLLLAVLKTTSALATLKKMLITISPDRRIQVILIGLFFVGFIEGLAGFGTPAMLAAPLLLSIGFPVRAAIVLPLIGDTISVPFGAVGTPFLIGLEQGASFLQQPISQLTIPYLIAIGLPLAFFAPIFMSITLTSLFGGNWKEGAAIWKQAAIAGLCFSIPYSVIAVFLGPEFPSLLGSLIGGVVFVLLLRTSWLQIPEKRIWDFSNPSQKDKHTSTATKITHTTIHSQQTLFSTSTILKAITPYFVIICLLLLSRITALPSHVFFFSFGVLHIETFFNQPVLHSFRVLYSPGLYLFIGSIVGTLLYKMPFNTLRNLTAESFTKAKKPLITLATLVLFAQLLLYSEINMYNYPSIPVFAAEAFSMLPVNWIFIAPFVGLFGAFVTGSVTVSNLLFSQFQAQTAILGQYPIFLIVSLQILGAAAGNMIALHNIIAVLATANTNQKNKPTEKSILALLIKPALLYSIGVATIAYIVYLVL